MFKWADSADSAELQQQHQQQQQEEQQQADKQQQVPATNHLTLPDDRFVPHVLSSPPVRGQAWGSEEPNQESQQRRQLSWISSTSSGCGELPPVATRPPRRTPFCLPLDPAPFTTPPPVRPLPRFSLSILLCAYCEGHSCHIKIRRLQIGGGGLFGGGLRGLVAAAKAAGGVNHMTTPQVDETSQLIANHTPHANKTAATVGEFCRWNSRNSTTAEMAESHKHSFCSTYCDFPVYRTERSLPFCVLALTVFLRLKRHNYQHLSRVDIFGH